MSRREIPYEERMARLREKLAKENGSHSPHSVPKKLTGKEFEAKKERQKQYPIVGEDLSEGTQGQMLKVNPQATQRLYERLGGPLPERRKRIYKTAIQEREGL